MKSASRRILRLQRQILKNIRAEVRKNLGPQSRDIRRYYESYKREFHTRFRRSTKDELLRACLKAGIILMGDYHTFAQSQKAALRLLSELENADIPLAIGLEMIDSEHQEVLSKYLANEISEKQFLELVNYEKTWGFPWQNFKPLLEFAKKYNVHVLALNKAHDSLESRDRHAAKLIANYVAQFPKRKLFVLYGDLHLARSHIPRALKTECVEMGIKPKVVTLFQNSESVYWRLASQNVAHEVDVVALSPHRFCIMNAAPWVKLQSYLDWTEACLPENTAENSELMSWDNSDLHSISRQRLEHLCEAIGLELPLDLDFQIKTLQESDLFSKKESSRLLQSISAQELRAAKMQLLCNRAAVLCKEQVLYVPSLSVNTINEALVLFLYGHISKNQTVFFDEKDHFYYAVIAHALCYFGSKTLNHKRKCDLEDDLKLLLERKPQRGELPAEKLQRVVAKSVLRHLHAERIFLRDSKYRMPSLVQSRSASNLAVFLETARKVGLILGEKLYKSFIEGKTSTPKLKKLFHYHFQEAQESRALYLGLLEDLQDTPLGHTSKLELF